MDLATVLTSALVVWMPNSMANDRDWPGVSLLTRPLARSHLRLCGKLVPGSRPVT